MAFGYVAMLHLVAAAAQLIVECILGKVGRAGKAYEEQIFYTIILIGISSFLSMWPQFLNSFTHTLDTPLPHERHIIALCAILQINSHPPSDRIYRKYIYMTTSITA